MAIFLLPALPYRSDPYTHNHHELSAFRDGEAMELSNYKKPVLIKETTQAQPRCERNELIDRFLSRLNPPRIRAGYKALTYTAVATIVEGMTDFELNQLFTKCDRADVFGKMISYLTKKRS